MMEWKKIKREKLSAYANTNPFHYCMYVRRDNQQLFEYVGSFAIDLIGDYLSDNVCIQITLNTFHFHARFKDCEANP